MAPPRVPDAPPAGIVASAARHTAAPRGSCAGRPDPLLKAIARFGVAGITVAEPDLEELFMAYYHDAAAGDAA